MATWIFSTISLLSVSVLSSCLILVESRSIQQVLSPIYDTECEFDALEHYSEQCGSTTVTLPTCNTGYRRIWWCEAGTNGFPEGFDPYHDACGNCPPDTYQSRYNKCRTCRPCSQCEEGQIVEKACEMDHDTVCRSVEPTSSLPLAPPLNEATPLPSENATLYMDSSPAWTPSEIQSVWPTNRTDPTKESSEPHIAIPHMHVRIELWVYRALIMALILLLVGALFGWRRECLQRKKLQALLPGNDIQLVVINNNGAAQRRGDREPDEETAALLKDEGERSGRNQATSNSRANAATGNHLPAGSPGIAHNLDPDGASGNTSDNTSSTADDGSLDRAHDSGAGVTVDGAIGTLGVTADGASGGDTNGAIGSTNDGPFDSSSSPKYINCGAMLGSAADGANDGTHSGGVLCGGGTDELMPDDEIASDTILPNNTQHDLPSETGTDGTRSCANSTNNGAVVLDECTDGTNSDAVMSDGEQTFADTTGYGTVSDAVIPGDEQTCTETSNNDTSGASGGGADVPVDRSPHGVQVGARGGACGPSSDEACDDVRRANLAMERLNPEINADDVVTTQFLQHVAQEISHSNSKTICRMLGLLERDIDDVEMLTHKTEQGFEFLKRLLGDIGKDLTYRSIIRALIKCKNKNHADNLIEEFNIMMLQSRN